jgi:mono/diheme cytochrome c family protein
MKPGGRALGTLLPLMTISSLGLGAEPAAPRYADGAAIFAANCAVCHGARGAGQPALAPPLTGNPAHYAASAEGRRQLALTVLYGLFGDITVDQKHYNFKMPEFSPQDDRALAAVLNFVVFDLGSAADDTKPISPDEIASERNKSVDGSAVREHRAAVLGTIGGG